MGWLLPSSLFPGTGEDAEGRAGERGGHSAPLQGHQHRSLPVTTSAHSAFAPLGFLGTPPAIPCPPGVLTGTWVSPGSILHYQTSLALRIGNFYNPLLGWKR